MASHIPFPIKIAVGGTRTAFADQANICATCISFICSLHKALPMCKAGPDSAIAAQEQTIIWKENGEVCIRIARRKNRPKGSGVIKRRCSCSGGKTTCAIHTLWDGYFAALPDGAKPWARITAHKALDRLRQVLRKLNIPDAEKYGTHDFRRGHAEVHPHIPLKHLFPIDMPSI